MPLQPVSCLRSVITNPKLPPKPPVLALLPQKPQRPQRPKSWSAKSAITSLRPRQPPRRLHLHLLLPPVSYLKSVIINPRLLRQLRVPLLRPRPLRLSQALLWPSLLVLRAAHSLPSWALSLPWLVFPSLSLSSSRKGQSMSRGYEIWEYLWKHSTII